MQETVSRISEGFDRVLKEFPEERRRLLGEIGQEALAALRSRIGGAGKVQRWQDTHPGSGGGYVAVRALADTYQETKNSGRYAVGYVTNAIEGGHEIRQPGALGRRKSRAEKSYVPGKHFYRDTRQIAENIARRRSGEFAEAMKKKLEG